MTFLHLTLTFLVVILEITIP